MIRHKYQDLLRRLRKLRRHQIFIGHPLGQLSGFLQDVLQLSLIHISLTELFIAEKQRGACRVHGGGFAGVIMAMLPNDLVDEYISCIEKATGKGSAYRMSIRPYGAVCVSELI